MNRTSGSTVTLPSTPGSGFWRLPRWSFSPRAWARFSSVQTTITTMDAMTELLHPGLVLIFGGLIAAMLRGVPRAALVLLAPLAAMVLVWTAPEGVIWRTEFLGHPLTPFVVDRLSTLFLLTLNIMALCTGV